MARVLPDDDDVIVWKLDETSLPFANSSSSPYSLGSSANLVTANGTVTAGCPGLFTKCVRFAGFGNFPVGASSSYNRLETAGGSAGDVPPPITVSGWVNVRSWHNGGDGYGYMLMKRYRNDQSWSPPYVSLDFTMWNTVDGTWRADVTVGGTNQQLLMSATDFPMPLNAWTHIGMTYDGTVLKAYLNGALSGTLTASPTGSIDFGTHGPWVFGAAANGDGSKQEGCYSACDFRVARIIRPLEYFKNIYRQGVLAW